MYAIFRIVLCGEATEVYEIYEHSNPNRLDRICEQRMNQILRGRFYRIEWEGKGFVMQVAYPVRKIDYINWQIFPGDAPPIMWAAANNEP